MVIGVTPLPVDLQLNVDGSAGDLSEVAYEWLEGLSARLLPDERHELAPLPARVTKGPGEPGSLFGVLAISRGGITAPAKTAERNCSASGLAWLRKELGDLPEMAILEIGVFDEMGHRGKRLLSLVVRRHPVSPQWLRLSVLESDERLDGSAESLRLQQGWLKTLRAYAEKWDPGFGHISYGHGPGATTLEDRLPARNYPPEQREPKHTVNECRRHLRGYSWLTIAPKELAAQLGGQVAMTETGAFRRVDVLAGGALWLQATERFEEFHDDAVTRVFDALAPVLRPGLPVEIPRYPGKPPHLLVFEDAAERVGKR